MLWRSRRLDCFGNKYVIHRGCHQYPTVYHLTNQVPFETTQYIEQSSFHWIVMRIWCRYISAKRRTQPSSAGSFCACSHSCSRDPFKTTTALPDRKSCSPVRRWSSSMRFVYMQMLFSPLFVQRINFVYLRFVYTLQICNQIFCHLILFNFASVCARSSAKFVEHFRTRTIQKHWWTLCRAYFACVRASATKSRISLHKSVSCR